MRPSRRALEASPSPSFPSQALPGLLWGGGGGGGEEHSPQIWSTCQPPVVEKAVTNVERGERGGRRSLHSLCGELTCTFSPLPVAFSEGGKASTQMEPHMEVGLHTVFAPHYASHACMPATTTFHLPAFLLHCPCTTHIPNGFPLFASSPPPSLDDHCLYYRPPGTF